VGNAVIDDLVSQFDVGSAMLGYLLSSVQFGFIIGTLTFAFLMIADRFSPSKVFMVSAILGGLCNMVLLLSNINVMHVLIARFGTGFFLAGIYPVGMKIASDYYKDGLGKALGFLVGALVLGTAFPHLLKEYSQSTDYQIVIQITSLLAFIGGVIIFFFVPDGPYRKSGSKLQLGVIGDLFRIPNFRKAAIGYFGHMWELYAFWGFIPILLKTYVDYHSIDLAISFWSFIIIAVGFFSCIIGGYISLKSGSRTVARFSLIVSGVFCLCSPLLFQLPTFWFLALLSIWGMVVISDSPQFSTLVAAAAPAELRGTGLTIVNCIGFAITIVSIQLLSFLVGNIEPIYVFMFLGIGPLIGLYGFKE